MVGIPSFSDIRSGRLFIPFWAVDINNFPEGLLMHRKLQAEQAASLIREAISRGKCICVSDSDLLAPYKNRQRKKVQDLCALLIRALDVPISFERFLHSVEEESGTVSVLPLQAVTLAPDDALIVVECDSVWLGAGLNFELAPDTLRFSHISSAGRYNA